MIQESVGGGHPEVETDIETAMMEDIGARDMMIGSTESVSIVMRTQDLMSVYTTTTKQHWRREPIEVIDAKIRPLEVTREIATTDAREILAIDTQKLLERSCSQIGVMVVVED